MSALSERITIARKAAGVSQDAAARQLKMSRPTYIAIEKGTRDIKPDELVALAGLLKTQVSRLVRQEAPPPRISPHLRGELKHSGSETGLDDAIEKLASFIDDYLFLLERTHARLIPVNAPPPIDPSTLPLEQLAELAAQQQRNTLGFGVREPIGNLRLALDQAGVHVFVDVLHSKLAGLYTFVPDFGYCILVNRLHPYERMRWTIAHEYGHFLFDRDKPGVDYLSTQGRKPQSERFCDEFAACFLMPADGVRHQFKDAKDRTGDVNVGDVCRIADHYKVSLMAMTLRMESLKLIRHGTWDFLKEQGVKVRDLKLEAGLEDDKHEKPHIDIFPDRYLQLAVQAWNAQEITTGQFAKIVRRDPIQARELAESRSQSNVEDESMVLEVKLNVSVLDRENASA